MYSKIEPLFPKKGNYTILREEVRMDQPVRSSLTTNSLCPLECKNNDAAGNLDWIFNRYVALPTRFPENIRIKSAKVIKQIISNMS
jgi:hypothetical protein